MDLWDLTKLLVRRWLVVVPLLAISGVVAVQVTGRVQPEYTATAFVQLVPPVTGDAPSGQQQSTPSDRNPWLGLGLETLANAAIVAVSDHTVLDALDKEGLSSKYTLTMNERTPLVTFEAVSPSRQQAELTAQALVVRFTQSVASLQTAYNVKPADSVSARRLDRGMNISKSTSKVKRAAVAVIGVGLALTVALTVVLDAFLRRRARRPQHPVAALSAAPDQPSPEDLDGPTDQPDRMTPDDGVPSTDRVNPSGLDRSAPAAEIPGQRSASGRVADT